MNSIISWLSRGGGTEFDVVIVGSASRPVCALNLDKYLSCAVINSRRQGEQLHYAQARAARMDEQDLFESHFEDTLTAGRPVDREAVWCSCARTGDIQRCFPWRSL
jgi:aspartate oxidase